MVGRGRPWPGCLFTLQLLAVVLTARLEGLGPPTARGRAQESLRVNSEHVEPSHNYTSQLLAMGCVEHGWSRKAVLECRPGVGT
jgi:hypothetical protein